MLEITTAEDAFIKGREYERRLIVEWLDMQPSESVYQAAREIEDGVHLDDSASGASKERYDDEEK